MKAENPNLLKQGREETLFPGTRRFPVTQEGCCCEKNPWPRHSSLTCRHCLFLPLSFPIGAVGTPSLGWRGCAAGSGPSGQAAVVGQGSHCPQASQAPLGSEVFERSSPIPPRQVLVELLAQRLEAAPVPCAQAKLGDVEAGGVGHVDHEGIGQDQQLILLGAEQQPLPSASAWW